MAVLKLPLLLLLMLNKAYALREEFFVQAAAGGGFTELATLDTNDNTGTWNFTTHGGFHFGDVDLIFNSQISIAEPSQSKVSENNTTFQGPADYHSFALGPYIRYISNLTLDAWSPTKDPWKIFFGAGYLWSISTLKPEDDRFPGESKLTYWGKGPTFSVGLIEIGAAYPVFVDISYKLIKAWKVRFVEITKDGRLSEEQRMERLSHRFEEQTISINLGVEFL